MSPDLPSHGHRQRLSRYVPPRSAVGAARAADRSLRCWRPCYSIVIPPFETPDEIWHYAFIQHVATGQGLPVSAPDTAGAVAAAGRPSARLLSGRGRAHRVDRPVRLPRDLRPRQPAPRHRRTDATTNRNYLIHHADEDWPWRGSFLALHLARLLLGGARRGHVVGGLSRASALILGPRPALLGTAVVAFIPQFVFISAAASNDNAVNALASLVLVATVALIVAAADCAVRRARRFGLAGRAARSGAAEQTEQPGADRPGRADGPRPSLARPLLARRSAQATLWTGVPAR